MLYTYRAEVVRIIDGDTVVLNMDLGLSVWQHNLHIRLAGINAPEMRQAGGKEARDYLAGLLPAGAEVIVTTAKDKTEKFGRYLGVLIPSAQKTARPTINERMISTGHATAARDE